MDNMSDIEVCYFCQSAIKTLKEEKKNEVMNCVGEFVCNPRIAEINKKIANFHSIVTSGIGLYGPNMRVGTKPEVVNIKVNFA